MFLITMKSPFSRNEAMVYLTWNNTWSFLPTDGRKVSEEEATRTAKSYKGATAISEGNLPEPVKGPKILKVTRPRPTGKKTDRI